MKIQFLQSRIRKNNSWYNLLKRGKSAVIWTHKLHGNNFNYLVFQMQFKETFDENGNEVRKELWPTAIQFGYDVKVFHNDKRAALKCFEEFEKKNIIEEG